MSVSPGTRLGPYEVISLLGAGGMGEVFRARDTRLDRNVAIKVLPAEFASNANLKLRFEREAKTISQLNHPHICTLYDVGNEGGVEYLVMELLEGDSLADRLARGPLPLREVLRYGIEISDALDKAHRAGIVHRDLKPGNIVITKSGAKLLDFGLAKPSQSAAVAISETMATEARPLTQEGTIVGTFQYMAPEQLEGAEADSRSDIFALGAVLYEMATGKRAFEGKTKTSLIASIVSAEPKPISDTQPMTPTAFEQVVRGCLAKDVEDRIQTAHDVFLQLKWISETASQAGTAAPRLPRRRSWMLLVPLALIAAALLAWLGGARWERSRIKPPLYRVTIETPEGSPLGYSAGAMALSPDGSQLAYAGVSNVGGNVLLVRRLNETAWRTLNGTAGARNPFWSPDGTKIGYCVGQKLMKISAEGGGGPEEIATSPDNILSASWSRQGTIVYISGGKLYRIKAAGADPVALPPLKNVSVHEVSFLPDGKHLLCTTIPDAFQDIITQLTKTAIVLTTIDGSEPPVPVVQGSSASWVDGSLFFTRNGVLYTQPFDPSGGHLSGEPQAVGKVQDFGDGAFYSAVASEVVFLPEGSQIRTELQRRDRTGKRLATIGQPAFFFSPRLSHDGTKIAVDVSGADAGGDIWIYDVTTGGGTRFTFAPENESVPVWAPGDREIAYFFDRPDSSIEMRKPLGGGSASIAAEQPNTLLRVNDWSPDGRSLLASTRTARGKQLDIIDFPLSRATPIPVATSPAIERSPRYSPDGRFVVYGSNESGRDEIYVQPFPPTGSKWQISTDGGLAPVWNPNGRSIFFINAAGILSESAITFSADGSLSAAQAQSLFPLRLREGVLDWSQYDVAADGTFILNAIPDTATTPMTMIINWKSAGER